MMVLICVLILWMEIYKATAGFDSSTFLSTPEYCRYKFNIHPLNWRDAQEACRSINRTLVKVDVYDTHKLSSIMDMATSIVNSRLPDSLAFTSRIWVGVHAEEYNGEVSNFWEDCDKFVNNLEGGEITLSQSCMGIDLSSSQFNAVDCEIQLPYICEAKYNVPCFDFVPQWNSISAFSSFEVSKQLSKEYSCSTICIEENSCLGFADATSQCLLIQYQSSITTNIDLNVRHTVYTMGFIGFDKFTPISNGVSQSMGKCLTSRIQPATMIDITSTRAQSLSLSSDALSEASLSTPRDIDTSFISMSLLTYDSATSSQTQQTPFLGTVIGTIVTDESMSIESSESSISTGEPSTTESITQETPISTGEPSTTDSITQETPISTGEPSITESIAQGTPISTGEPSKTESITQETPISTGEPSTTESNLFVEDCGDDMSNVTVDRVDVGVLRDPDTVEGRGVKEVKETGEKITGNQKRCKEISEKKRPNLITQETPISTGEPSTTESIPQERPIPTGESSTTGSILQETPISTGEHSATESIPQETQISTEEQSATESILQETQIPTGEQSATESIATTSILSIDDSSSSSVINSTDSIISTGCMCHCSMYKNKTYTQEEVQKRIKEIKEKLTIKPKNTRAYKRSLICASDDRISARNIGYAGVVIMIILFGLIVLMDMPRGIGRVQEFIRACRDRNKVIIV